MKSEQILKDLWNTIKWIIICIEEVTEIKEEEKEGKKYLKNKSFKFPDLNEDMNLQI